MQRNCSLCQREFTAKRSTAMYCSGKCRVFMHRIKKPSLLSRDLPLRFCQQCDNKIWPWERTDKLFCSNACKQKYYRDVGKGADIPAEVWESLAELAAEIRQREQSDAAT